MIREFIQDNLTKEERNKLRQLVEQLEKDLERRNGNGSI